MSTLFVAEVASPCGGRTVRVESDYLAGLEAALDRAFGIACDEAGRELGALAEDGPAGGRAHGYGADMEGRPGRWLAIGATDGA